MYKVYYLIFFFALSSSLYSQTRLSGKFIPCEKDFNGEWHEEFNFRENGEFSYTEYTDLGNYYGAGIYTITNKLLTITFDTLHYNLLTPKYVSKNLPLYEEIIVKPNETDTLLYTISVLDYQTDNPLPGGIILLRKETNEAKYTITGGETDKKGKVTLRFSKAELPVKLVATYIGYTHGVLNITDSLDKEIVVRMTDSWNHYLKSGQKVYKIKNIDEDSFSLYGIKDYYEWILFEKQ